MKTHHLRTNRIMSVPATLVLMLCCLYPLQVTAAGQDQNDIIGLKAKTLKLYTNPDDGEPARTIPAADLIIDKQHPLHVVDTTINGRRLKVNINNEAWWIKKRQVETGAYYDVEKCSAKTKTGGIRGAVNCNE